MDTQNISHETCSLAGCSFPIILREWCGKHYGLWKTTGSPNTKRVRRPGNGETVEERFWDRVDKDSHPEGCWIWLGAYLPNGYPQVVVERGGTLVLAYRAAWFFTYGYWPEDCLCHRCDHPSCVNPLHLWEGSQSDNIADRHAKGRTAKGEQAGLAVLKEADVIEIRRRVAAGEYQRVVGEDYGIAQTTVSAIVRRATWTDLE